MDPALRRRTPPTAPVAAAVFGHSGRSLRRTEGRRCRADRLPRDRADRHLRAAASPRTTRSKQNLGDNFKPPMWKDGGDWTYPLGTDPLGRDLLSRLIYGARYSLVDQRRRGHRRQRHRLRRRAGRRVLWRLDRHGPDAAGRHPARVPLRALRHRHPGGLAEPHRLAPDRSCSGISSWVIYARVVRSRVLTEREKDYATAARALGASRSRVLAALRPAQRLAGDPADRAAQPRPSSSSSNRCSAFSSLGLSPPTPSWGSILADGRQFMMIDPWMALLPGFAIIVTVLSISLAADGFADCFDPKLAPRHLSGGCRSRRAEPSRQPTPDRLRCCACAISTTDFPLGGQTVHAVQQRRASISSAGRCSASSARAAPENRRSGSRSSSCSTRPGRVTDGRDPVRGARSGADRQQARWRRSAARRIGMIFQDPGNSLNPVLTVGYQLRETTARQPAGCRRRASRSGGARGAGRGPHRRS